MEISTYLECQQVKRELAGKNWVILGHRGDIGGLTGVQGGSRGGLEYPFTGFLIPLKVSYGIRFGFKHHMMVQIANLRKVELTILILGLWGPPRFPKMSFLEQIKNFGTAEVPEIPALGVFNALYQW